MGVLTYIRFRIKFTNEQMRWGARRAPLTSGERLMRFVWDGSEQDTALRQYTRDQCRIVDFDFAQHWCVVEICTNSISDDDLVWLKLKFDGVSISTTPYKI